MQRRRPHPTPITPPRAARVSEHLPAISAATLTAMVVLAHLVPFDTAAEQWNNVAGVMLWLLLFFGWALANVLNKQARVQLDRVTVLVLVLTLLPMLSAIALLVTVAGNGRLALNIAWQWASFGVLFLLARQWLRSAADVRMLAAVMLAIAVGLSAFAVVQFTTLMPALRARYEKDPKQVLLDAGLEDPPGSPRRKHFEDRLQSTEPTGTFALTNSLAGLLAPWLVFGIALGVHAGVQRAKSEWREAWWKLAVLAVAVLLIAGVLVLTKSRTAMLATMIGVGIAALYVSPLGRRVDWRILLAVGFMGTIAVLGGVVSGALDVKVLSEAPKSVLYRLQYWQATAAMIRDHAALGVGPGNFQEMYKHYQLPEASENIADPHNFVLEIWAMAGTPAVIVLGVLMLVFPSVVRTLRVRTLRAVNRPNEAAVELTRLEAAKCPHAERADYATAPFAAHAFAALVGVALGFGCGFLSDMFPDRWLLATAVPAGALTLWLLRPWIERGELTLPMLIAPLVTLLVNLLAAGGVAFPGVATSLWLLLVMALVVAEGKGKVGSREWGVGSKDDSSTPHSPLPTPYSRLLLWLFAAALAGVLYHVTVYNPVFRSTATLSEAVLSARTGNINNGIAQAEQAARIDPFSPRPWLHLAALWEARLRSEGDSPKLRSEFEHACDEAKLRDPRSEAIRSQIGCWRLRLYRSLNLDGDLANARFAFQDAADRYPNNAFVHAQLAWTSHLLGTPESAADAAREAALALELDRRHTHKEYKLAVLDLFDPGPAKESEQPPGPKGKAEQVMEELRTVSNEMSPTN